VSVSVRTCFVVKYMTIVLNRGEKKRSRIFPGDSDICTYILKYNYKNMHFGL
jgi:hypothetical protein